jgi:hypothetical protein
MREKIMSEIKRLSAKHGKTVGKMVFERETGITEGVWRGKYWARWNDIIKEAGFDPNQKTIRTNDEFFILKLIDIFRHYQKIPTSSELQLYRNIDPEVPTARTFDKSFGLKNEMLRKLKVWVSDKPYYTDVAAMLDAVVDEPEPEAISETAPKEGWVYVIQYGDSYKIGAGSDLEKRVKQVTTKLPDNGELIHAIKTDDPFGIENYWHKRFKDKRAKNNSEFFKLNTQDIRAMKRRKFM